MTAGFTKGLPSSNRVAEPKHLSQPLNGLLLRQRRKFLEVLEAYCRHNSSLTEAAFTPESECPGSPGGSVCLASLDLRHTGSA